MSYDINYINKKGELYKLEEPMQEGGTQELGGNTESWLNVTYNYSWYYHIFLDKEQGIRWLYEKNGSEYIERLEKAIQPLARHKPYANDYWAETPGNCIQPLRMFLSWCKKWPEGIFQGD